jgi:Flp pilus assembly protein TadD
MDGALQNYRHAVQLKPDYAGAYTDIAILLDQQGDLPGAEDACRRAVAANPDSPRVHSNLAAVLDRQERFAEAAESCRQALARDPGLAEAHSNLAAVLWRQRDLAAAVASCRQAISINPNCAAAYCNLGTALSDQGDLAEGLRCYERVLTLQPDSAAAIYYSGLTHLLQGNFSQGWQNYEHRWRLKHMHSFRRNFPQPLWRGEALHGARILLYPEQGLGDILQFVRYVPLVAACGGKVILEVPPTLKQLLSGIEGATEIVVRGESLPDFSWQCPFMSLPLAFGTDLASIPAKIPYLHADPDKVQAWSQRLEGEGLRVGLVWAGNPKHVNDCQRSLSLAQFAPVTQVPGVSFYALQKGPGAIETQSLPAGMRLIDLGPYQSDIADTAAIVANLDLVLSVDTSVAHLAGALGKPVWILLQYMPDWRWLLEREDSPWYPTARLFRQSAFNDWTPVLQRVAAELARLAD